MIKYFLLLVLIILITQLFFILKSKENFHNKNNYAYITLVTNDLYVPGVIALGNSLNKVNTKYKIICLYKNISKKSIKEIKSKNYELLSIESLNKKDIKLNIKLDEYEYNIERFRDAFNKLYIWSLTKYDKLIYLDCDMLVYKNIDHLFNKKSISAVQGRPLFNSGLIVLKPNMKIFNDLNNFINTPDKWIKNKRDLLGKSINDQALLGNYFKDYNQLPREYNVTKSYHSKIKKPYVKHWNFKDKPWFFPCDGKNEKNKEWCKYYKN